jgi:hypothetical protein
MEGRLPNDHLNNEISVSGDLTTSGVKAAAKSRAVAAFDRLVGNFIDLPSAWVEGVSMRRRATNDGERQMIEAIAKYGVEQLGKDGHFAERALETHYKKIARSQANLEAVVAAATEDLLENPPSDTAANAGPTSVSEEFVDGFERYAERASTEELQRRWGRVLSSEIRKPGTFNPRVLRVTDELDSETARLFEGLCRFRVDDQIIQALSGEISLDDTVRLVEAGLMLDPGTSVTGNIVDVLQPETLADGVEGYPIAIGNLIVVIARDASAERYSSKIKWGIGGRQIELSVFQLTEAGAALGTIVHYNERHVAYRIWTAFRPFFSPGSISILSKTRGGRLLTVEPSSLLTQDHVADQ